MSRSDAEAAVVPRRTLPGSDRSVSVVGFALEERPSIGPDTDRTAAALLRRGRARGVTTIDLPEGPGADRLERLVALAFPESDPELTVIVQRSAESVTKTDRSGHRAGRSSGWSESVARSVQETNARLGANRVAFVDWRPTSGEDAETVDSGLAELAAAEGLVGVVRRWEPAGRSLAPAPARGAPSWLSGSFSILDQRPARALASRATDGTVGFFARDPLASGRLDGSRLAGTMGPSRPGIGPPSVRDLEQEFAPVLELGFLTEGRRRTLAQAALRYVLRWPWTLSALVPLPSPERLEELLAAEHVPDLTDEEMDRLEYLASRR